MKTINELAQSLGVTRQTIYNVCKRQGINLASLTTEKRGNERLFDSKAEEKIREALENNGSKSVNLIDRINKLEAELVKNRQEIDRKQEEIDKLCKDKLTGEQEAEGLRAELAKERETTAKQAEELQRAQNRIDGLINTTATQAVAIQQMQAEKQKTMLEAATDDRGRGRIRRAWLALTGKE